MPKINIRFATESDLPEIFSLIKELAEYEKLSHLVSTNTTELKKYLFGENKFVEIILAEYENRVVGQALFFKNFSTFLGKPGIYLEDLFVKLEFRGKGIGKALLEKLLSIAKERDYGRVEWSVLDWNESAIEFYKNLGAEILDEWKICRITSDKF